jgi:glycosyltransferase involved in cell wall biosynthesis
MGCVSEGVGRKMKVLVNALSVTNLSGRHVLLGHLSKLAEWTNGRHEYYLLHHKANRDICKDLGENVKWIECPELTTHWARRTLWERSQIPNMASKLRMDLMFTPSGTAIPSLPIPQITFAQNPWCLVSEVLRKPHEKIKAALQRKLYKEAMLVSNMMIFNSEFMRKAYRKNAGFEEAASEIVYQGINEETHEIAANNRKSVEKKPAQILSVSTMAPHKGVETLIRAIGILRRSHGIPANLILIGAWPDKRYENKIRVFVNDLDLGKEVTFKGYVPREELYRYYAESKIFCLMSWCESFGIPAVEAQAFGTPVISSNCCAIPEVCGKGGVYPDPGDFNAVADQMARLLTNDSEWAQLNEAAIQNATKYRWDICSKPLLHILDTTTI